MTERSTIFEGIQIGVETTPGTLVAASKKLLAMTVEVGVKPEVDVYRPTGSKFATVTALAKEWVEGSISGPLSYTDIVYPLSSIISTATPTGAGASKTWTFSSNPDGPDTNKTFTIEGGSSGRAHRFGYGLVTAFTRTFTRDECTASGSILGQALEDDVTITPTPTAVTLVPIQPTEVLVYFATTRAGLTGATALARTFSVVASLTNRFGPVWALNGQVGFAAHTELAPTAEYSILMAADDEGMAQLAKMRTGDTIWMKVVAIGGIIESSIHYSYTETAAIRITNASPFRDEGGIYAIEWTGTAVKDATWGKAFEIVVVNSVAAL